MALPTITLPDGTEEPVSKALKAAYDKGEITAQEILDLKNKLANPQPIVKPPDPLIITLNTIASCVKIIMDLMNYKNSKIAVDNVVVFDMTKDMDKTKMSNIDTLIMDKILEIKNLSNSL